MYLEAWSPENNMIVLILIEDSLYCRYDELASKKNVEYIAGGNYSTYYIEF